MLTPRNSGPFLPPDDAVGLARAEHELAVGVGLTVRRTFEQVAVAELGDHLVERRFAGRDVGVAHADQRLVVVLPSARVAGRRDAEARGALAVVQVRHEHSVLDDHRVLREHTLVVDRDRATGAGQIFRESRVAQRDVLGSDARTELARRARARHHEVGFDGVTDGFVRQQTDERRREQHLDAPAFRVARVQELDGALRRALGERFGRAMTEEAVPAAGRAERLGAALHLAAVVRDRHDAELGPHETRPGLGAVARDDAFFFEDLAVAATGALDRCRRAARERFHPQHEVERLLERSFRELGDAIGIEAAARKGDRRGSQALFGARLRRRTSRGARGVDRALDRRLVDAVGARKTPRALLMDTHADARVLGDLRRVDAAFLDRDGARAFLVIAQLDETVGFAAQNLGEEIGRVGGGFDHCFSFMRCQVCVAPTFGSKPASFESRYSPLSDTHASRYPEGSSTRVLPSGLS